MAETHQQTTFCFLFLLVLILPSLCYEPTWESLDSRPLPDWYDEAKLGIFIHWGVFSVPSFSSEWFWWYWQGSHLPAVVQFMKANYRPDFTYADFAKQFSAEFFNANEWADLFQASGAKYIVFVSKHHEGFTNWPSKYSFNWNSMDVGPNRDIVGELMNATRGRTDLRFGLYHSQFEWFNPLYLQDQKTGFKTRHFVEAKTLPELYELVNTYKPDVVWADGDGGGSDDYWKAKEFLAWLYNDSPVRDTVVTNDRWGANGIICKHGGFYTCADRYSPGVLQRHKWENAMTLDKHSWGFRRNAKLQDFLTMDELLRTFITTVSCGGNMLMNVGPPSHGHITPMYEERLRQLGSWLKVNGQGIYASRPWTYQNDTAAKDVWYTMKETQTGTDVYAFVFSWPTNYTLTLEKPQVSGSSTSKVFLLGYETPLLYKARNPRGLDIVVPQLSVSQLPCQWLWTFLITNVVN